MRAMVLHKTVSLQDSFTPLALDENYPDPEPRPGEVLIRVSVCGVCHTELDEIEGRTAPPKLPVIPGHQVVGRVVGVGDHVRGHRLGDRVGVGWIYSSSGGEDENLSDRFRATGRDHDGGYAERMVVPQDYAYPIPAALSDSQAAPLLCAGAVGYRALRLAGIEDGQSLGLTGFGGSNHLVLQMAIHRYPNTKVHVFARSAVEREFALELGACWAGDTTDRAPTRLDAIIDTTPAWKPVVEALANLRPGGRLVINAIRKNDRDKDSLQSLSYHEHLWMEREIKSVANVTQHDLREFLPLAAEAGIRPEVTEYPLEQANQALLDLNRGDVRGAKVLVVG